MPSLLKQSPKSYRTITPTSSPYLQMQYDIKNYKQHWHNVTHAEAKVDHAAPPLPPSFYERTQTIINDGKRLEQIARENKQMVQKINIINRTIGMVDSHMPPYPVISNFHQRKIEARTIAKINLGIIDRIINTKSYTPKHEQLQDWKRIEKVMTHVSLYPLFWKQKAKVVEDECVGVKNERRWTIGNRSLTSVVSSRKSIRKLRPKVFLDLNTNHGEKLGQLVIELYSDIVPETAENFRSLCAGDNAMGLTYHGNPFCRIIPGLYCQAGDITQIHGSGGKSIYGDLFEDENFILTHAGPGVVTMHNTGPNTNNSQFMITFKALPTLNGHNVVVGKVIKGLHVLLRMEEMGTPTGKLLQSVTIHDCGEVKN